MREIKFRAWQRTHKYMTFDISMVQSNDGIVSCFYYGDAEDGISMSEDWDVMQFTGLKDKNGKEIYKDDIVSDGGTIRRVKWSDQNASFYLSHIVDNRSFYKEFIECAQFQSDGPVQLPDIEVIGNIHQNPELLNTSPSSKTEGDAAGE